MVVSVARTARIGKSSSIFMVLLRTLISPGFWQNFLGAPCDAPVRLADKANLFRLAFHSGDYPDFAFMWFSNHIYLSILLKD